MPESTRPQPLRSALLTVDLQNDFVLPGAPLETPCAAVLPAAARLVRLYRNRGLPIFHVVRLYLPDGSNADLCRREDVAAGKPYVLPGSDGARLAEEIRPANTELDPDLLLSGGLQKLGANEFALYKPRWSAFFGTDLAGELARREVTTAVVAGTWYPNCVRATLYDAAAHDLRIVAVRDAIAGLEDRDVPHLERICCRVMVADQYAALLAQYADLI